MIIIRIQNLETRYFPNPSPKKGNIVERKTCKIYAPENTEIIPENIEKIDKKQKEIQ